MSCVVQTHDQKVPSHFRFQLKVSRYIVLSVGPGGGLLEESSCDKLKLVQQLICRYHIGRKWITNGPRAEGKCCSIVSFVVPYEREPYGH